MFPRAQERPKGASGTKWESGGPILLNFIRMNYYLYCSARSTGTGLQHTCCNFSCDPTDREGDSEIDQA